MLEIWYGALTPKIIIIKKSEEINSILNCHVSKIYTGDYHEYFKKYM
jgi:hypothetical protein